LSAFTKEITSRFTDTLISSICSGDLPAIHSLLFSSMLSSLSPSPSISGPILVNNPNSKGWSPIHHCVAALIPSTQVLDALYCAGADVSLFTTYEQQTPLHILARSFHFADMSHSLATFILHLIQDLRAPLSARDKNDETCIHIAAEHGKSLGMLMLLLQCDVNGTIRKMKNSRG
jgi:ankyrin repeat protein